MKTWCCTLSWTPNGDEIGSEESDQTHETLWFEESVYFNGQQAVLDSDDGLIEFTTVAFNCFPLLHCWNLSRTRRRHTAFCQSPIKREARRRGTGFSKTCRCANGVSDAEPCVGGGRCQRCWDLMFVLKSPDELALSDLRRVSFSIQV